MVAAWVIVSELQSVPSLFRISYSLSSLGYLIVPGSIAILWKLVHLYAQGAISLVLSKRSYKIVALVVGIGYGIFYMFATSMVAPPDEDSPPPPEQPFFVFYQSFGPVAIWPNIEWWHPSLNLFGSVSIGTGLLLVTLSTLIGIASALMAFNLRYRGRALASGAFIAGSMTTSLTTSLCCCCTPAIMPVLAVFLGSAAGPLQLFFTNPASFLFNLAQISNLLLALVSLLLSTRRIRTIIPKNV